ncbi:hypothetical protein, partial [Sporocytophaga myxococcoides]|uniref:hypothetical protein n=1 Tax=Sporocytophaga myxococcoides TaxID=153721 RepID=UPI001E387D43
LDKKTLTESNGYVGNVRREICNEANEGVDEKRETLHTLTSLLLTNTTLRTVQQGSTEQGSLTINSR